MTEQGAAIRKTVLATFDHKDVARADKMWTDWEENNPWFSFDFVLIGPCVQYKRHKDGARWKYVDKDLEKWQTGLQNYLRRELPEDYIPIQGQIRVWAEVFKMPPKGTARSRLVLMERGHLQPEKTPDTDNYVKSILDAMKGVVWVDDNQCTLESCEKFYSQKPRVEVYMEYRQDRLDI